jgi:hypothetical protein
VRSLVTGLVLSILLTASLASAQVCPGFNSALRAVGFQALTVSTAAVGFTVPVGAEMAVTSQELADVRWRDDGTNPTASVGMYNLSGGGMIICTRSLSAIRFIRAGSTDALISAVFYGR